MLIKEWFWKKETIFTLIFLLLHLPTRFKHSFESRPPGNRSRAVPWEGERGVGLGKAVGESFPIRRFTFATGLEFGPETRVGSHPVSDGVARRHSGDQTAAARSTFRYWARFWKLFAWPWGRTFFFSKRCEWMTDRIRRRVIFYIQIWVNQPLRCTRRWMQNLGWLHADGLSTQPDSVPRVLSIPLDGLILVYFYIHAYSKSENSKN